MSTTYEGALLDVAWLRSVPRGLALAWHELRCLGLEGVPIMVNYLLLAIDGIDGSGKIIPVRAMRERLMSVKAQVVLADRSGPNSSETNSALTSMIKASDGGITPLTPEADGLLRIARATERLALASAAVANIACQRRSKSGPFSTV